MLFGLKNASTTFQQAIEVVLATVKQQNALVYSGEIIVFFKTPEHYL